MRREGKVSKVAVCKKCDNLLLASHVDHISKETEKEFSEMTNEGFVVRVETINRTKKRKWGSYPQTKRNGKGIDRKKLRKKVRQFKSNYWPYQFNEEGD